MTFECVFAVRKLLLPDPNGLCIGTHTVGMLDDRGNTWLPVLLKHVLKLGAIVLLYSGRERRRRQYRTYVSVHIVEYRLYTLCTVIGNLDVRPAG